MPEKEACIFESKIPPLTFSSQIPCQQGKIQGIWEVSRNLFGDQVSIAERTYLDADFAETQTAHAGQPN